MTRRNRRQLQEAQQNASCCEGELYRAIRDRADAETIRAAQQRLNEADARLVQFKAGWGLPQEDPGHG